MHETRRTSPQQIDQGPPTSSRPSTNPSYDSLPSYSRAIRIVSYDNQAYSADEQQQSTGDIPSISMAVFRNEVEASSDGDNDEVVMLHL